MYYNKKIIQNLVCKILQDNSVYRNKIHYMNPDIKDYGPCPFVLNINEATLKNNNYCTALWTGCHMQVTLMSIKNLPKIFNLLSKIFYKIHNNLGIL